MPAKSDTRFNERLVGTIILCGIGLWYAVSRRAVFTFGGRPDDPVNTRHPIYVNASGLGAIAIGSFIIGLGIVNLALGIRGPRRIPVFWTGAGLVIAAVLYGLTQAALEVATIFR